MQKWNTDIEFPLVKWTVGLKLISQGGNPFDRINFEDSITGYYGTFAVLVASVAVATATTATTATSTDTIMTAMWWPTAALVASQSCVYSSLDRMKCAQRETKCGRRDAWHRKITNFPTKTKPNTANRYIELFWMLCAFHTCWLIFGRTYRQTGCIHVITWLDIGPLKWERKREGRQKK